MLADVDAPSNTSRRSTHKSTSASAPGIPAIEQERPTPTERIEEFRELYPEKAETFVLHSSADDPRDPIKLRRDAVQHWETEHKGRTTEGQFYPLTWADVLEAFLEWFEGVRDLEGQFTDGDDTWTKRFLNSYHPEYLEKHYAQLMGLHREVVNEYENPQTALLTLTSSGTYDDGDPRGPVDHQRERRDAWQPTYKRLYDRMEALREEGQIRDWCYLVIEEHHPGPFKANSGYGHDHPVIIADGELREADFYDVVDAWVEECPGAEHDAHNYRHPDPEKRPIKTRRIDPDETGDPGVVNSAGGYLTKYLYPDGGEDPLERPIEQLAQQSIKWATNTRRFRKSDRAGEAIKADLCRQKYEDPDRDQDHAHAERLRHRREGRGPEIVCDGCGSSWGVDGDGEADTVVEARLAERASETPREPTPKERLRSDWGNAPAAARLDRDGVTSFERPAPVTLEAYIIDGEEYPSNGTGGGVDLVPVVGWSDVPMDIPIEELRGDRPPPGSTQARVVRAIVDEVAAATDPIGAATISARIGIDESTVAHRLEQLAQQGRIYSPGGEGYLLT